MEGKLEKQRSRLKKYLGPLLIVVLGVLSGYWFFGRERGVSTKGTIPGVRVEGITSVAVGPDDKVYVGGDFGVKVFSPEWKLTREWKTPEKVVAIAVDGEGNVYAAYLTQVEKFDKTGASLLRWGRGGCDKDDFGLVSGISAVDGNVFVADSGERIVYRFADDGSYLNDIGSKEKDPEGQGLIAPSPFIDCAASSGVVFVNNLGRRRVEHYDFEGNQLKHWGKSGWKDDEFPGCCNPTNIAVVGQNRILVSDKGIPRLKLFDGDGTLITVLGGNEFNEECKGIDLAVDSAGRAYAVDRVAACIRVFNVGK